ncbi:MULTISPECIES: DUF5685 family protein [Prauserella salsuginis group]|uniref:DUF5685 family protein n=1 Tax=Prauserella salsuginis TaxID=387889 RepID=A0ABW6GC10_9PSEU|nr:MULTISPECIES: DUF5685 family protein [Prauserella salsuginis group]MCR3722296.1 hypothetical protein [Prauserella flava]MCR3736294.1 hypothetical protein [Prauserella salsuginis]
MFGIIRPCRHRLSERLRTEWMAHLCGLCLALRDEHGQLARTATNYDGLLISALVDAQSDTGPARRTAGPCALRGMRGASVAVGDGARLAASVSLVLASAKVSDHVVDGDGMLGRRAVGPVAQRVAAGWADRAAEAGGRLGLDTEALASSIGAQPAIERDLTVGDSVLAATAPTEHATAAAFAHTAVLAGRPENADALAEAGRLFGRIAHLLDAVEDLAADAATGTWNPLPATGTDLAEARRLCDDAVLGVRLALDQVPLSHHGLVHALLVHELERAVTRTFGHAGSAGGFDGQAGAARTGSESRHVSGPSAAAKDRPGPVQDGQGGGLWLPKFRVPPHRRNPALGCCVGLYMCCSCQFCCRDPYPGPCDGKPKGSCDCDCCDSSCCDC